MWLASLNYDYLWININVLWILNIHRTWIFKSSYFPVKETHEQEKETYLQPKRPSPPQKNVHIKKETHVHPHKDVHTWQRFRQSRRNRRISKTKPTYTKKRPIYTKRDLITPKRSYIHDKADEITECPKKKNRSRNTDGFKKCNNEHYLKKADQITNIDQITKTK